MALEEVLDIDEDGRLGRHSDGYHVAVFGTPGDDAWAWRFEGHHLSVNATVADGQPIAAPLLREEELARALVADLPARLREQTAIAGPTPGDIITGTATAAGDRLEPPGVPASRLPSRCRDLPGLLLGTYFGRLAPDLASAERDRIAETDPAFAWSGG
jgi:hypothetical protein